MGVLGFGTGFFFCEGAIYEFHAGVYDCERRPLDTASDKNRQSIKETLCSAQLELLCKGVLRGSVGPTLGSCTVLVARLWGCQEVK